MRQEMGKKGKFISIEGIDGSGKSSLVEYIPDYLQDKYNVEVVCIREPGGTYISEKIREMLLDVKNEGIFPTTEAMLYAAARCQVVEEIIKPALNAGKIVIADRYLDSTIAYQGFGRKIDLNFLKILNNLCTGGLLPDLTILLDVDENEGQRRRKKDIPDRLEKEGLYFQSKVRQGYLTIAAEEPGRIKIINAHQEMPDVIKLAFKLIDRVFEK